MIQSCIRLADSLGTPLAAPAGAFLMVYNGTTGLWEMVRQPGTFKDVSAVTITTIAAVWTPASGKKVRLLGGNISVSAAASVLFEDNSAGAGQFVFRTPKLAADTPFAFDLPGNGVLLAAANNVLKATASAAGAVTGTLYGCEE